MAFDQVAPGNSATGRPLQSEKMADYCKLRHISFDWMLTGCLKGLNQMMDERRGRVKAAMQAANLVTKYAQLKPEDQAMFTAELYRIMAQP
ncbi:hypothetical protein QA645_19515 [Bradyrhizobium sp. CIAT3101]|uniref:hypothetical protein n=1 Tax=Bradyrhizobium sp. CIAT3101 TaxID=439387 RepID=UPI0024B1A155|nr:hypothetical protein [Bradyrhizobium sp. CIAT3101]WFU84845.1 hypothetical protein QA645_19515 [Bradyrhizobium sp. CIAT3101]